MFEKPIMYVSVFLMCLFSIYYALAMSIIK